MGMVNGGCRGVGGVGGGGGLEDGGVGALGYRRSAEYLRRRSHTATPGPLSGSSCRMISRHRLPGTERTLALRPRTKKQSTNFTRPHLQTAVRTTDLPVRATCMGRTTTGPSDSISMGTG